MKLVIVRGFGFGITHLAEVPESSLFPSSWPSERYPFTAVLTPIVALCEVEPRSVQPVLVVMEEGTTVKCKPCRLVLKYREQLERSRR